MTKKDKVYDTHLENELWWMFGESIKICKIYKFIFISMNRDRDGILRGKSFEK